jgi:hypothetical protein
MGETESYNKGLEGAMVGVTNYRGSLAEKRWFILHGGLLRRYNDATS